MCVRVGVMGVCTGGSEGCGGGSKGYVYGWVTATRPFELGATYLAS